MTYIPTIVAKVREILDEDENKRYREESDAKLKQLQDTPMAELGPDEPLNIPTGRPKYMGSRGYDTPDFTSSAAPTVDPEFDDPNRDYTSLGVSGSDDLSAPLHPEGEQYAGLGSGGPEGGGGLSEGSIIDIRRKLADREAQAADKSMRSTIYQTRSPDEAASAIDLAGKVGVNRAQAEANFETYKRAETMKEIATLRSTAPKLRAWLDYNPENLEVAHDDVDNLGWWEKTQTTLGEVGGGIGGALASGYLKISEGAYGVARAGFELNDQFVSTVTGKTQVSEPAQFFAGMQEEAKAQSDSFMPEVDDPTARGVLSGFQSLPPSVMAAIMGIMSGGAAPALAAMGGITGGSEYGRAREQGMSPSAAAGYGTGQGLIEAGTEALPMGWLLGDVAKRTPFFEMLAKQALGEGVTEQVATHSQDFLSWAILPENADKPIATYLEERGPAAYETLIATLVGTGVQTSVAKSVDMTLQAASEGAQARRADQLAKTFEAMSAGAAASKLLKRLPEKYRQVVADVTKDGPLESVRVQPEAFEELAQSAGVSTEQLAQAFRIDPADINSALTSGEDVVIPSGNYAAALQTAKKEIGVSGETIHAAFAPNMRLRAEDFTAKEREAMKAVYEEERAATEQANSDTTFADAADRVREAVRTQLADAKIFNNETASTQAIIASEMAITLAHNTQTDPEALWNDLGFKVTAQVGEDPELQQSANTGARAANPPTDAEIAKASRDLTDVQFRAWKAAREGLNNQQIADLLNEVEDDAIIPPSSIAVHLLRAREKGYDSDKTKNSLTPETLQIIDLAAQGLKRSQIAARVYPDKDINKARNQVGVLLNRHKAAIEAKRAEKAPVEELAQSSLDMSEAATAQRAQEQGFDTSKVLYHGTANGGFDRFDPYGRSNHGLFGQGIYLTDSPEVASTYTNKGAAKMERQGREPRQAVYPVYTRLKNPIDMDAAANIEAWRAALGQYSDIGLEPEMTNEQVYRNLEEALEQEELPKWEGAEIAQDILRNMGHDGIVHVGGGRVDAEGVKHGVTIVFDPENVRGKFAAFDPANTASDDLLAQEKRGGFSGINLSQDPVIRLYESANLSTFSHEAAHWYLTTLEKLARTEAPHPFVVAQLAAVREWAGKSAEFQIYDESGQITPEGVELQEAFSESFEAYLREGKAPSTALRQVFATMKAWLLRTYKQVRDKFFQRDAKGNWVPALGRVRVTEADGFQISQEIRDVFDRMLATEEAIAAARTGMEQDADRMAKALLDKGVITEKAYARTRERLQAAREKAEADLMARLMEEYERSQKAWYRDEERQVRRDVTSEIDERPEQRAYAWLSGKGWRDTQADHVERAAEAEFMQAVDEGLFETDANDDTLKLLQQRAIERGLGPLILMFRTTSGRVIAFPGENGAVYHDLARNLFGLGDLKLEHGMYNPRKWPTLADMDAAGDRAWYATTGEHADTEARELAQRTYQHDKHREQVKTAYDYLRDNPEAVSSPLSKIMAAVDVSAYAADRARRLVRKGELAQLDGPVIVYRGSEENGISSAGVGRLGSGVYLAEDPEIGGEWGGQTGKVDAYRINGRLFDLDETTAEGLENYEKQEDTEAAKKLFTRLKSEGYVGVRDPWSGHINVFVDGAMERYADADVELGATWTNEEPELGQSMYGGVTVRTPPFDGKRELRRLLGEPSKYLPWRGNPRYKQLAAEAGVKVQDVPVASIVPGQSQIRWNYRSVKERYSNDDASLPILVRENGRYYINDGTHRIAAQAADGADTVRARVIDLDAVTGVVLAQTGGNSRTTPPATLPPMRLDLAAVKEQYGDEALAAIPPEVRAYSAQTTDADQFAEVARDVRKTLAKKRPKSLWKFLSTSRTIGGGNDKISYRGIRDDGGELIKIIGEKRAAPGLIADGEDAKKVRSYTIEHAAEAAWAEGYFNGPNPPTPAEFLDALRADIDGQAKLYARADMADVQEIADAEAWSAWFDQNGIDINEKDPAVLKAQLEEALSSGAENAIGPDEAAAMLGGVLKTKALPDGNALLQALKAGPQRDKLIREETKRRMIEKHGDIFRDGTIMREAEKFARNEVQTRQDEIELEALGKAAGRQFETNLAKQMARENLRTKQVREVLNYSQWLTLEQRWMKKAVEVATKGDTEKAFDYKRYALINRAMFLEGRKLAEDVEKAVKHAKSFEGKDKRIRLAKAGNDYLQQIDQILDDYEFRPVTRKAEKERVELRDWFASKQAALDPHLDISTLSDEERMAAQQEEIERAEALAAMQADATIRNYKSLTVDELMAVRDQVDMIERMARRDGKLMVENDRRSLNLAIDDIEAQAVIATPNELPPESLASYAPKERNKRGLKEFFAELRTAQAIVRIIDGIDNGPLAKNTIHKLNTAGAERAARMRLEEGRVVALFREAYGINLNELRKDKKRFPGINVPLAKMERLTIALYWGTEISRRRIMDGYGWDQATVQGVLNSFDQRDWAFVQSVWEYVNSLYPEASKAHEDVHGLPLSKQPGLPIVTRFGVIEGNYFPIKYNPHQSSRADQQALTDTAKRITAQAGTRKATGSTKERVKGKVTMPVLLDFYHTLASHVNEVVDNITMQRAVLDAGRIIAHPRTQQIIVARHGWVTYKTLVSAMKDTRNGLAAPNGPTERIAVRVRNGATNVALGLNMTTVIKQLLGVTQSVVRLGGKNAGAITGVGWMLKGLYRLGFGAQGMQNGVAFILERSPYMRVRMQVMNQAIADQQRRINEGNIKADISRVVDVVSMFMIQRVQFLAIDAPTWLGAYEKFTASGMSPEEAAASADQIVIDAQGSGEIWQVSAFQRGGPIQRIFTNYITAAVANWNLAVNTTKETNFRNPGQAAIWAMNMGILMVVPVIGSMAVASLMSPGGDDDDEPLEEQYLREQVSFLLGPLGLFGQLSGAAAGFAYKGPQGTRAFEEASKVITETFTGAERVLAGTATAKDAIDILRPANMAAGVWFGYPAAALDKFVRGADAMMKGETDNPKALVAGPPRN